MPQRKPAQERDQPGANDVVDLAAHLDGFDPARYFDRQAEDAWREAACRWPILAAILRLDIRAGHDSPPDGHH